MFYLYRLMTDLYSSLLSRELTNNGGTMVAAIISEKRTFWYAKMLHSNNSKRGLGK